MKNTYIKKIQNISSIAHKCDRVCIKGPLVGNLKNEIIKFYDKSGFKVSFPLISERNSCFCILKSIFPAEYQDVKSNKI